RKLNATRGEVRHKGAIDLVTRFDHEAEALLRGRVQARFPAHHWVGEEQGEERHPDGLTWYVDPIDGTTNFVHGHPFFAISIALYEGAVPLAAVVQAPALGLAWWARRGGGCFRQGQACRVSATTELRAALVATGFPYHRWQGGDNNEREFSAFLRRSQGVRRCGAAALDLALVADGSYDLYWERDLKAWDMAAGALLVQEAGGELSDYQGRPADARSGELVASNGRLHAAALQVLQTLRGSEAVA
ncbi:MAG: inositol monophosphatase family protein, partial [Polyangiales bacterium]